MPRETIAIIGSGAAGLTSAYLLSKKYEISLYEKNHYLGGHTHTVLIPEGPDRGMPVDTGFIVYNQENYPSLLKLFARLGIEGAPTDMSFSYSNQETGLEYSSYVPRGLLAQPFNLFRPSFIRMIADILKFNKRAVIDLKQGSLSHLTLGEYLDQLALSRDFKEQYLLPMGAAIWSTPQQQMLLFPAEVLVQFLCNHGLLALEGRPKWLYVPGGSHSYIKKIQQHLQDEILLSRAVVSVERKKNHVLVRDESGETRRFDYVVLASHADESLQLLKDPTPRESELLGAWQYNSNRVTLHTDLSAMPRNKKAWASWNYIREAGSDESAVSVTYHMNHLQKLKSTTQYFVSLNRSQRIPDDKLIREIHYTHPCYTFAAIQSQTHLPKLNGEFRTFFCGSYFGYGFHEDAVKSASAVASSLGVNL